MRTAFLLALIIAASGPVLADELRGGASSVDITPRVGTPMAGYYAERLSRGVHDPLFAKAIVLERGGKKAALVSLDLISTTPAMVEEARREIEKTSGIHGLDVMISATHVHTGPVLQGGGARAFAFGGDNPLAVAYNGGLSAKIAESGLQADKALNRGTAERPVRFFCGRMADQADESTPLSCRIITDRESDLGRCMTGSRRRLQGASALQWTMSKFARRRPDSNA